MLVACLASAVPRTFAVSGEEARRAVGEAQSRVSVCYGVVADAARAGANVSGLLLVLDGAGGLLSRAVVAYGNGDYASAYGLAGQCVGSLVGFEGEADVLVRAARENGYVDFMVNVVGCFVGAVAVVLVGVVLWWVLKRRFP